VRRNINSDDRLLQLSALVHWHCFIDVAEKNSSVIAEAVQRQEFHQANGK
jgi:hypothetical protein